MKSHYKIFPILGLIAYLPIILLVYLFVFMTYTITGIKVEKVRSVSKVLDFILNPANYMLQKIFN